MTKRKTTTKQATQAPIEAVESVKQETNTKVASKPKQANTTTKKASTGGRRGRPKKVVVQLQGTVVPQDIEITVYSPDPIQKAVDVDSRTITYVAENRAILVGDKPPSLYEQFKAWLTYKLYYYTSYFKGY